MPKLTKQDIQDIAHGYTVKYVSNSFTRDELIIELAKLCLQAIDERQELLPRLVEPDEEEQTMADKIEQNIREIASRYKWAINEKNLPKIANAKRRFSGEEDCSYKFRHPTGEMSLSFKDSRAKENIIERIGSKYVKEE